MTGFSDWLETKHGFKDDVAAYGFSYQMKILAMYGSQKNKRQPIYGRELSDYRDHGKKPYCRIVIAEQDYAEQVIDDGGYALAITDFKQYEFRSVYGLDVLYVCPDAVWGMDVLRQIAGACPKSLTVLWPDQKEEEVLWN